MKTSFALIVFLTLVHCFSGEGVRITQEPVLDQTIGETEELCLKSRIFSFGYPCLRFRGEKENATGKISYTLRYEVGTFDVDLPLGVALRLGETWYNLQKTGTDYSSTIVHSSRINPEIIPIFLKTNQITVSYSNRKKTENTILTPKERQTLQERLEKLTKSLEEEPKFKLEKK